MVVCLLMHMVDGSNSAARMDLTKSWRSFYYRFRVQSTIFIFSSQDAFSIK